MQVINVLRDERNVALCSQTGQRGMGGVGFRSEQILAARIVEIQHEFRISAVALRGRDILKIVLRPKAISIPECSKAGFCGYSGPCQ